MTAVHSLWATLHDGILESVRHERDGEVSLVIDVPHVRHHAELPADARFVIRLTGSLTMAATRWCDPSIPRPPPGSAPATNDAWSALGSMRSIEWDGLAASLTAPKTRFDIIEPSLEIAGGRVVLSLGGNYRSASTPYEWLVLRIEAASVTLAHADGEAIPIEAFDALGEAYWDAWKKRGEPE